MASPVQFLSFQQFQQTFGYEKPCYEYWFGEAIQKSMPTSLHGSTQILLGMLLFSRGWKAASEVRLRLSPYANPVPDLVADPKPIESPFPTKPFALCIEILAPSDDLRRLFQKCAHYLDWGIQTVWIIDPDQRKAYCMRHANPEPAQLFLSDSLTAESGLVLPLREIFEQLDRLSGKSRLPRTS
jgi:Uma2 family endonuclease